MKETSQTNRTIMSVIAVVIGLMMAYIIPFIVQTSLERVLIHLTAHIENGFSAFSSGLPLFDFFYSVWQALIFAGGAALIVISWEIKKVASGPIRSPYRSLRCPPLAVFLCPTLY